MTNDYNALAEQYARSHKKPDKRYSMSPTMRTLVSGPQGQLVYDVGCGDGFFSRLYAHDGSTVFGIDNSAAQIQRAQAAGIDNASFLQADMFRHVVLDADVVSAPFVLNYAKDTKQQLALLDLFYQSLSPGGKIVTLSDMPIGSIHNNQEFGTVKRVHVEPSTEYNGRTPWESMADGTPMSVSLFDEHAKPIVTLESHYYSARSIRDNLRRVGFTSVTKIAPVVSSEGVSKYGAAYWDRYKAAIDVAYFIGFK